MLQLGKSRDESMPVTHAFRECTLFLCYSSMQGSSPLPTLAKSSVGYPQKDAIRVNQGSLQRFKGERGRSQFFCDLPVEDYPRPSEDSRRLVRYPCPLAAFTRGCAHLGGLAA